MKVLYLSAGHGNFANGINYTDLRWGKFYHFTENGKRFFSAYEGQTNRIFADKLAKALEGTGITVVKVYHENKDIPHMTQVQTANTHFIRHKPEKALWFDNHSNAVGMNSEGVSQSHRGYSIWTTVGYTESDKVASMVWNEVKPICEKYGMPTLVQNWQDGDVDYEANFDVLNFTFMPAVLNELGFFTNITDAKLLINEQFQNEIVEAYKKAILKHFA